MTNRLSLKRIKNLDTMFFIKGFIILNLVGASLVFIRDVRTVEQLVTHPLKIFLLLKPISYFLALLIISSKRQTVKKMWYLPVIVLFIYYVGILCYWNLGILHHWNYSPVLSVEDRSGLQNYADWYWYGSDKILFAKYINNIRFIMLLLVKVVLLFLTLIHSNLKSDINRKINISQITIYLIVSMNFVIWSTGILNCIRIINIISIVKSKIIYIGISIVNILPLVVYIIMFNCFCRKKKVNEFNQIFIIFVLLVQLIVVNRVSLHSFNGYLTCCWLLLEVGYLVGIKVLIDIYNEIYICF